MTDPPQVPHTASSLASSDRLDSWKEIAAYLRRDVKTVQRWEKREGMPVHRHLHDKIGSVYAFRNELDGWAERRRPASSDEARVQEGSAPRRRWLGALAVGGIIVAVMLAAILLRPPPEAASPLANARFLQLTDFNGVEQAAAISRDGRLVAFLSDRDGRMDVWVTHVGSGEFHNVTKGTAGDLVNPSVRTLGFSPDGTMITFWARRLNAAQGSEISIWGIPVLGGSPRVYLDGVAEYDWSDDAGRVVYHTPGPGDPMFVRNAAEGSQATRIFSAPAGLHAHFPLWSPDGGYIYFVQGSVPDRMDVWRIRPAGGAAERITNHDAAVSHPVFLNAGTLAYLSSDEDGSGPWLYTLDLERRIPRRATSGFDRYTSLAASRDGRRLVATLASPKSTLWKVPLDAAAGQAAAPRAIALTTGNGSSPRLGDGFLLYVSSKGTSDSLWKLVGAAAVELWSAPETRVGGGPALSRDGRRIAFSTRRPGDRTLLWIVDTDGRNARTVAAPLELQGAPAWTPDGEAITIAAVVEGEPRLFRVPLDGGPPAPLVNEHSMEPAWSPDGQLIVFSGPDIGTTFPVKAATAAGAPYPMPALTLTRGARHVAFLPDGRSLIVMRGDLQNRNLWTLDLETGAERQLTNFGPGFGLRDFDVAPDGRELVVEQVQEHSDIVLLELAR